MAKTNTITAIHTSLHLCAKPASIIDRLPLEYDRGNWFNQVNVVDQG